MKTTGYGMKLAKTDSDGIDTGSEFRIALDIILNIAKRSVGPEIVKRRVVLEVFP